ncbi:hypothetical protein [Streptomyces sp. NPDC000410]|uniref:hypothetical protein n=1 Tax=Streptomyces sp. NPDC000410 TaxID=3154254 RepID=UPI003330F3B8
MDMTAGPAFPDGWFDRRQTYVALFPRTGDDWYATVVAAVQEFPALRCVDRQALEENLTEISDIGAFDLCKLISFGSLLQGPHASLRQPDTHRDECLARVLESLGPSARFWTNHGHAEHGDAAHFLASSFHVNGLADATIDVCLVGVSTESVLTLWRFEND